MIFQGSHKFNGIEMRGTIKRLSDKGFGFIACTEPGKDIFFHSNDVLGDFEDLVCGESVAFNMAMSPKGEKAVDIDSIAPDLELGVKHELIQEVPGPFLLSIQECTQELIEYVIKHPEFMYEIHAATFEALVAEIYRSEGFLTERISKWNEPDGGVDLIAVRHVSPGVDIRVAIQCKRWSQRRRLSADPLRSLAGVLDHFKAHVGVVATTGLFTPGAVEERNKCFWRISLREYDDILASLRRMHMERS
jgi:CspA family cold shock protein